MSLKTNFCPFQYPILNGIRDVVVALAHTLISADLGILTLPLLHKCLQLSVVALSNSLGLHLDRQVATGSLNVFANVHNGLLQALNTNRLIQAGARQNVERRRYQLNLDLVVGGVASFSSAQGSLDGVDALVAKAGDFDIGTDLGGLGSKALSDVRLQLFSNRLAGESDVVPDFGVAVTYSSALGS